MFTSEHHFSYCIVVDLDYTLVSVDTSATLVRRLCPWKYKFISLVFMVLKPLALLSRKLNKDLYKLILLRYCLNRCINLDLENATKSLYYEVRKSKLNVSLLNTIKKTGGLKILLTASIDIVANKFKDLGFDLVISSVVKCGETRPFSLLDLYGKKHVILSHLLKYCGKLLIIEDSPEPQYYELQGIKVFRVVYNERE